MKRTLLIAFSLIRIRRLFFSLLLIPILLSLLVVAIQVVVSTTLIHLSDKNESFQTRKVEPDMGFLRSMVLGREAPFPEPIICRWRTVSENGESWEEPPTSACEPDRLDAAIHVADPAHDDPAEYIRILNGNVERIHLCHTCSPDLIFYTSEGERRVQMRSIWSAAVLTLVSRHETITDALNSLRRTNKEIGEIIGKRYFIAPGFLKPVNLSDIRSTLLFVFNIASLIVVSLWLALKAHRRVLDYFSRNGALLPMVAANGKENFYGALWAITLLRVAAFLFSALPLLLYSLSDFILDESAQHLMLESPLLTVVWGLALIASLSLATLVASIADLRHRSHLLVFVYRFVPLLLALAGAVIWSVTFLFDGQISIFIRTVVSAFPVIGMMPVFISLIFQPDFTALLIHLILSIILIIALMRMNAHWFGAHLEEL